MKRFIKLYTTYFESGNLFNVLFTLKIGTLSSMNLLWTVCRRLWLCFNANERDALLRIGLPSEYFKILVHFIKNINRNHSAISLHLISLDRSVYSGTFFLFLKLVVILSLALSRSVLDLLEGNDDEHCNNNSKHIALEFHLIKR